MKQKYVAQLKVEDKITDFYMVKATGVKQDTNGRSYLDIMLMDNSGEITAKKWDLPDEEAASLSELKEGDLVKVKGQITDWKNQKQIRIEKIRKAAESDGLEISDFVKSAPEDPQEMYDFIHKTVEGFEDAHLRTLALRFLDSEKERLLYYPAASKNHHAEMGGLLYHIKRMLMAGMRACEVYTCLNRDLLLYGVVVHDMEKLNEIESDKNGVSPGYSFEGQLLGHIVQGVREIERMTKEIEGFPREKAIMVEHMICHITTSRNTAALKSRFSLKLKCFTISTLSMPVCSISRKLCQRQSREIFQTEYSRLITGVSISIRRTFKT